MMQVDLTVQLHDDVRGYNRERLKAEVLALEELRRLGEYDSQWLLDRIVRLDGVESVALTVDGEVTASAGLRIVDAAARLAERDSGA